MQETVATRPKVFGIGLNRTGTTTLGTCMQILGYRHLSCRKSLLRKYRRGELEEVFAVIDQHESFEDWPYPLMYREFADRYPDAKFILTVRRSPEAWVESLKSHSLLTSPKGSCRRLAYGYPYPHGVEAEHIAIYERHNAEVPAFFESRGEAGRLLTLSWEAGDGWAELCDFLGEAVPDTPFPRSNVTAERSSTGFERQNRRLIALWRLRQRLFGARASFGA